MSWDSFGYFAVVSMVLALAGALVALCRPNRTRTACWLTLGGIAALACFVAGANAQDKKEAKKNQSAETINQ